MPIKTIFLLIILSVDCTILEKATTKKSTTYDTLLMDTLSKLKEELHHLTEKQFETENSLKRLEIRNARLENTLDDLKNAITKSSLSKYPRDCKDVQDRYGNITNIYRIQPEKSSKPFLVLCDMITERGGWTYVMNRFNGSQDFNLDWKSYKEGFGKLDGEFWLGLENLYTLTGNNHVYELRIELADWEGNRAYAQYASFSIGSAKDRYPLELLTGYSGTAGDAFSKHVGNKFSTRDNDQDNDERDNCANYRVGGWWYDNCFYCKLTGKYFKGPLTNNDRHKGIHWSSFHDTGYSLMQARMMIRPREINGPIKLPQENR